MNQFNKSNARNDINKKNLMFAVLSFSSGEYIFIQELVSLIEKAAPRHSYRESDPGVA